MNLPSFLKNNSITVKEFADTVQVTPQHIYGICRGDYYPSRKLAKRIEEITNGQVTAGELLLR